MIEAIVRLMDTPEEFTGPVNLGNATEFTIAQLADPDTALAEQALGRTATTPLEVGLKATIAYFDALLSRFGRRGAIRPLALARAA